MNKEELIIHCEKQIKMCQKLNDYKHLLEHQTVLDLLEENKQLQNNWNELKEWLKEEIEKEHHTTHWEMERKMQEIESRK